MPPLKKAVHEQKEKYRTCIRGVGTVGATVSKVDNATSTELLLDGQRLGEYAPALQSNPLKQKLVREEKLTSYPAGLDTAGAFNLFWEDLKKPDAKSRYYQHLVMMPDGVVMMLTCLAALMRLLDDEGPKIIKLCVTHTKRGILDFKSLVLDRDCQRLQDVVNIESAEDLDEFSQFVGDLGIEKIQNWWDHKELHAWIIPCLVKSQSPISPDDWDNTPAKTNTGEGQHHWTKSRTGVKLVLVEAMESARKLDEAVYGAYSRTARTAAHHTAVIRKSQEVCERSDEQATIEAEIAEMNETRKQAAEQLKELKALNRLLQLQRPHTAETYRLKSPQNSCGAGCADNLLDADFFACLDTINSMPMAIVPQTETDNTFGFFGDGFAYGLIPDASFNMQTDDFAGTTLSLPTLPLPPVSPPTMPAVTAAASMESTGDGNRKRKRKNEVDPENIVHIKWAKQNSPTR
ncbi:hypothetical protein B0H14DRAFT_3897105 [Mycena olivaceomarginata]|nr:hypothetical protein B0H14DRAFT_3897105 [Mycena olivaceomarginata]